MSPPLAVHDDAQSYANPRVWPTGPGCWHSTRQSGMKSKCRSRHNDLFPQSFKTSSRHTRIKHRMPRIAVPQIVLHRSQVDTFVGEVIATRVAQLVGMHAFEFSLVARSFIQV